MENDNGHLKDMLKTKSNIKTLYVVPQFNSENDIVLREERPASSPTNIIVETALPHRRNNKNVSSFFASRGYGEKNRLKKESISIISDSPGVTDDNIDDGNIYISNDPIKDEINEQFFEITMADEVEQKPKRLQAILPFFPSKDSKYDVRKSCQDHQNKAPQMKNIKSSNDKLEKALQDVYERHFSPLRSAHINGIKLETLEGHLNGLPQRGKCLVGADLALSANEETTLVEWIKCRYKSGFPVKKIDLINKVANMVIGRQTRFKEGVPGEKWFLNFMMRHPNVSSMGPSARADSRQVPSKKSINKWFKACEEYLLACGNSELLSNPSNVGTAEEIILRLNPTAKDSDDEIEDNAISDEDTGNIALVIGACANGEFMPPMPVFSCRKPSPNLVESVPYGWGIGLSKEGAVDKHLLLNYFKNILIPWLTDHDKLPFILFIDKLKMYLSVETADYCAQRGLIIYNFYPNSHYVIQPLYKCVIDGIKTAYNSLKHYESVKQSLLHFCPNLEKVLRAIATPTVIKESFQLCGIFPFDQSAADYKKCQLGIAQKEAAKNFTLPEYTHALDVIETLIGQEKLAVFFNAEKDSTTNITTEDKSLYKLWNKLSTKSEKDLKQIAEPQDYRHERILREGTRKLPRPDTYLKVTEDEEPLCFANFSSNILRGIESTSTNEYSSRLLEGVELIDTDDDFDQDVLKSNSDGSKCMSAKLWKQYYQSHQPGLKNKRKPKVFNESNQFCKKVREDEVASARVVCCQCLKADDKLLACRVCRKSIHFECMVSNEKQILDQLRKDVLDFECVCPSCS